MSRNYASIEFKIAQSGFFSEYLPPCFKLSPRVFHRVPSENCDLIEPYCFTMSRHNGNDARRNIYIPEVGSYVVARNFIWNNQIIKEIIEFSETGNVSFSPILGIDDSIMRHEQVYGGTPLRFEEIPSSYMNNISNKIIKSAGAKQILKLDISNCFSSFYTHMIPSILLGLEETNQNYNKSLVCGSDPTINPIYHKYVKLDTVIRHQNLNRTNGLLTGTLYSKIIAEGILSRIDKELEECNLKFSRYMDDYEVYIYEDEVKEVISTFVRILNRYGFTLNDEKTEVVDFPYYISDNLEKLFQGQLKEEFSNSDLMALFNTFLLLEQEGTKGAIRYLLKSLEIATIKTTNIDVYKGYLLTIIRNNERSLTKACSLLIKNKESLVLNTYDISIIEKMLLKHIDYEHDLEVLWLLYLLIETTNFENDNPLIQKIIDSRNELAHIILLRKGMILESSLSRVIRNATSWILLYELYATNSIDESAFITKLHLNKNLDLYKYLKLNNVHFCIF